MPSLLQRAVLELSIDVPVYRTEAGPEGTITLFCYGGVIHHWQPPVDTQDPEMAPAPQAPETTKQTRRPRTTPVGTGKTPVGTGKTQA